MNLTASETYFIEPNWPSIPGIHAAFSLRASGDLRQEANRASFANRLGEKAPRAPKLCFLNQVHSNEVVRLLDEGGESLPSADASITSASGVACTVMVADCLPVLFAHAPSGVVGAAHAGWRGLAAGVLENCWRRLCEESGESPDKVAAQTQVWLGACIGVDAFEVGAEVREAFADTPNFREFFKPSVAVDGVEKWRANLAGLARQRLLQLGLKPNQIYGNDGIDKSWCTFSNEDRFFSYRRQDGDDGRMAAVIWRSEPPPKY